MSIESLFIEAKMADVAHGDDAFRYGNGIKANFSSNVWPFGMSVQLRHYLIDEMERVLSYPSPRAETVVGDLASKHGVLPNAIMAVNGITEAIYLLAQAFKGSHSYIVGPTFGEYAQACQIYHHQLKYWHEDQFSNSIHLPQGIWWICNPNNPTGKIYDSQWLMQLVRANPQSLFVVDEAYGAFVPNDQSLQSFVNQTDNLVIFKSLTKSFAVPGIRTGYVLGSPSVIEKMVRVQPPWSVGAISLSVLKYSGHNQPFSDDALVDYLQKSQQLQMAVSQIPGFEVYPSPMGYFLVQAPCRASLLKDYLIAEHGILVRDASNFHGLGNRFVRIAAQNDDLNEVLLDALRNFSDQYKCQ
jgi:threonine-phosphate decarboxylase